MAREFSGRVAMVTGAGSGIGRASAVEFAKRGAAVVVSDIDTLSGEETREIITQSGGDAIFVAADTAVESDVIGLVKSAIARYGRLDFAHNNAGVGLKGFTPFFDIEVEDFDRVVNVNFRGVFLCMKYQIPYLLQQEKSAIVVTASRSVFFGGPGNGPYTASKHAVDGLVKSVALEFARKGLRVNSICPSYTQTTMTLRHPQELLDTVISAAPMGRAATPEEMAQAAIWLCSEGASFVNGVALPVDGGSSALPADLVSVMNRVADLPLPDHVLSLGAEREHRSVTHGVTDLRPGFRTTDEPSAQQ